ncbi:peptidylprolyl isomerase [Balneolaceae bacterium ANBcel3]|nr:peptidylprolyl isomerase [Balneolaceae bacterium ANBcel3]
MKSTAFLTFIILPIIALMVTSCGNGKEIERLMGVNAELRSQNRQLQQDLNQLRQKESQLVFIAEQMKDIKARIVTTHGTIEVGFFPEEAPLHCFNFIARAESGFYNGTQFHRIIPGFMIQGGDPNSKGDDRRTYGQGGPIVAIPHEFNRIQHEPGILSMARVADKRAGAGSQFFIMHGRTPSLDNEYTVFGRVLRGLDVVDTIANLETSAEYRDQPVEPVIIQDIQVFR